MSLFLCSNNEILLDKLLETNVVIVYICHSSETVSDVLNDDAKNGSYIIFVGNNDLDHTLLNNKRIIIARNFEYHIEDKYYLLTFTAWYLIVHNNLFLEYEYICLLEYDVKLESGFHSNLTSVCADNLYDIVTFFPLTYYLVHTSVTVSVMHHFLLHKNSEFKHLNVWYATSNHCMRRTILCDFVNWYYPDCEMIKKIDPFKISWYHERLFSCFLFAYEDKRKYNIFVLSGIEHLFLKSHESYKTITEDEIPDELIDLFVKNIECPFLKKVFEYYQLFSNIINSSHNYYCSRQCPSYFSNVKNDTYIKYNKDNYERQKELFEISRKSTCAIIIDIYTLPVAFIMLLANPTIRITCIERNSMRDISTFMLLKQYFNNKDICYIGLHENVSYTDIVRSFNEDCVDLIHVCNRSIRAEDLDTLSHICLHNTTRHFTMIIDECQSSIDESIIIDNCITKYKVIDNKCIHNMKILNISKI